jgi:hypothetical protein
MNAELIRPISSVAQTKKILTIVWTHLKRRLTPPRWVCPAFQAGGFYEIANRAIVPDTESREPRYIRQSSYDSSNETRRTATLPGRAILLDRGPIRQSDRRPGLNCVEMGYAREDAIQIKKLAWHPTGDAS